MRRGPLNFSIHGRWAVHLNAAWVFYLARRPADAAAELQKALAVEPAPSLTHGSLWVPYAPTAEFLNKVRIDRDHATPLGLASLASIAAASGERVEANAILTSLMQGADAGYICPYEMATAHAALGDRDAAFRFLESSYRERSPCLVNLRADRASTPCGPI